MKTILQILVLSLLWVPGARVVGAEPGASPAGVEAREVTVNGGIQDGKARLVIEALLGRGAGDSPNKLIYSTTADQVSTFGGMGMSHQIQLGFEILQGDSREIVVGLKGDGEVKQVSGELLLDWGIRREASGDRSLVLRFKKQDKPATSVKVAVTAETTLTSGADGVVLFGVAATQSAWAGGHVRIDGGGMFELEAGKTAGVSPLDPRHLPEPLRVEASPGSRETLAFRILTASPSIALKLKPLDPESRMVVLTDFRLEGMAGVDSALFELTGRVRVRNPSGGSLAILSGSVALISMEIGGEGRMKLENGEFVVRFDRQGEFPVKLKFNAAVRPLDGWNSVRFKTAGSALLPVSIGGIASGAQFNFIGASKPMEKDGRLHAYLPQTGEVNFSWKDAVRESEGRLFFSAEMFSQVSVGQGLMRQTAILEGRIMQGELNQLKLRMNGRGNVTRVTGEGVLSWQIEPDETSVERSLVVRFNQVRRESFALVIQLQTELGAFPQAVDAVRIVPDGATRFSGYLRLVNDGAARLEVLQSNGFSQISPEQFPESETTRSTLIHRGTQRFAFRFSTPDFVLKIQADNILPEVGVSQVLVYHRGESELIIDGELELDIREAPVRELNLKVPRGYGITRLTADGMADYFVTEPAGETESALRIVYGQPVLGRQLLQLRLEKNSAAVEGQWVLPRVEVVRARSLRGHVAISADAGHRLTAERTQGVTDVATAFFPKKVAGIQAAFRISEAGWSVQARVERLPQSIHADVLHLFSIGEGVGYGSSTMNFLISGAPVSVFNIELVGDYFNVEFTGREVRNWQRTTNGYRVQLHSPVSGPYTLLATFERPFKAQGDTLVFTGVRPLDSQSEQGYTLVISAHQFQVKPVNVSPGLMPIEAAEVPGEYRLFFDAPILAAYRYSARPFNLELGLTPLAQGDSLSLVVDRASLVTRVSKDGEVITDARYFLKNRGNPNLRIELPAGVELWSATLNDVTVVPVRDGAANLVPLPPKATPNTVQRLELKLAHKAPQAGRVKAALPVLNAPVLLLEWRMEPDAGRRLVYKNGSLKPAGGIVDESGFEVLARLFSGRGWTEARQELLAGAGLAVFAFLCLGWAGGGGSRRFGLRHLGGGLIGLAAVALLGFALWKLSVEARRLLNPPPRQLVFLAPIQQPGSQLSAEVGNVEMKPGYNSSIREMWPAAAGAIVWIYALVSRAGAARSAWMALGWTVLFWGILRTGIGASLAFPVLGLCLVANGFWPLFKRLLQVPVSGEDGGGAAVGGGAGAATAVLMLLLGNLVPNSSLFAASPAAIAPSQNASKRLAEGVDSSATIPSGAIADSVIQRVVVEGDYVSVQTVVQWSARKGEMLAVLRPPAVPTRIQFPTNSMKLVQIAVGNQPVQHLLATTEGRHEIQIDYQLSTLTRDGMTGFVLPVPPGLVNELSALLRGLDVDVISSQAVSIQRDFKDGNTTARLILPPEPGIWIGWRPRSRDLRAERALVYADWVQLFVPSAGVVEGLHQVQVRPAQGEVSELAMEVPEGMTITDVQDLVLLQPLRKDRQARPAVSRPLVALWRFAPDTRKLRVTLSAPQSRPFTLVVRSQAAAKGLPFEQSVGLVSLSSAAGQLGVLGVASGSEVQLDDVTAPKLVPLNLEDFPGAVMPLVSGQFPGLAVRRAFRYTDPGSRVTIKASAVEPDVRVESRQTLSIGEDRVVLAAAVDVAITRSGIFRLSFPLPAGLEVESVSGKALSHWTEFAGPEGRVVTLHLKGRVEGNQNFSINLVGAGRKAGRGWVVPKLAIREASKQRGQLILVPEQGLRVQVVARDGVSQVDPQKEGIRQKGVLAFRILQDAWNLTLDLDLVDAWVQVMGLQLVNIRGAQARVLANLQYQIENTGLKSMRVRLPTNAASVRFRGEQMADFLAVPADVQGGQQAWEVKLHRRMLGKYLLQVSYQLPVPDEAASLVIHGVQALDVNLQRGFVALESSGRLQIQPVTVPKTLQVAEWQSIPRVLMQDVSAAGASHAFRLVEPAFELPLRIERHEAARLLPARVNAVNIRSVVSDEGVMLTEARLEMTPGDKRMLQVALPKEARFWFAFVNQNGVWPWREGDKLLIPLEQPGAGKPLNVEIYYSSRIGSPGASTLDLQLLGPKFDLPLENITWRVFLGDQWKVKSWKGTLELAENRASGSSGLVDLQTYLSQEASLQREKSREAEQLLQFGNSLLEKGDPQQARRAFQAAFGLSSHDQAFNEDARVQLHNLKLQQAMLGLNARQAASSADADTAPGSKILERGNRGESAYSQTEARRILESNSAEENTALTRVAERLIQQQDAAVANPSGIRASIPQRGRELFFKRTVQVGTFADLELAIRAETVRLASNSVRLLLLLGLFVGIWAIGRIAGRRRQA